MKHPSHDEWIPFIFGEASQEQRQELSRHLDECDECAREVAGWRRSLRKLNRWRVPKLPAYVPSLFEPAVKWALAASIVLGVGLAIGRFTSPSAPSFENFRAQVEASVRSSLKAEMELALEEGERRNVAALQTVESRLAKASAVETQQLWKGMLNVLQTARADDVRAVQAMLRRAQNRNETELVALRKDLETLASATDEQIQQARLNLLQLASSTTPLDNQ